MMTQHAEVLSYIHAGRTYTIWNSKDTMRFPNILFSYVNRNEWGTITEVRWIELMQTVTFLNMK
jgi:hypothetical protein